MKRFIFILLFITVSSAGACAQDHAPDVKWLVNVLEIEDGSVVADIGAGDGDHSLALAEYIGNEGHIYSTELGSESLQELRKTVNSASVNNVTVVEGHPKQTNLPEECCDAIFLRRVYHHFDDPLTMNMSMWQSLKPGGKLAVIDFKPRQSESTDPAGRDQGSQHGITAETAIKELEEVGFILVKNEQRSGRNIYVVMEKPADS